MGLSVSIMAAINAVGLAWVSARGPTFGMLIAREQFEKLDALFFPALLRSTAMVVTGCGAVLLGVVYLNATGQPWSTRILEPGPLAILLATAVVLHLIYAEAVYLRAHKAEPFVTIAVVTSLATGLTSYLVARPHGAAGIATGYFGWMTAYLIVGTLIFQQKRREWHTPALPRLSEVPR
jgi:hypothetical protein